MLSVDGTRFEIPLFSVIQRNSIDATKMQEVSRVTQTLRTHVAVSRRTRRGISFSASPSRRRELSELNRRLRSASRRTVNKSKRRVLCATDSWLAFVTGDRVYMTVVYMLGFNFAFSLVQNYEVAAAMRSSCRAADESIWDWATCLNDSQKKKKKNYYPFSQNSRSLSRCPFDWMLLCVQRSAYWHSSLSYRSREKYFF